MSKYIEDNNSILYHVLYEFETFLSAICIYHKNDNVGIKNIALDSLNLHIRALSDFFSNTKTGTEHSDDVAYHDFISYHINDVVLSDNVREYVNKGIAHVTSSRSKLTLDNDAFYNSVKEILFAIKSFMEHINTCICPEYSHELTNVEIKQIQSNINELLSFAACCLVS